MKRVDGFKVTFMVIVLVYLVGILVAANFDPFQRPDLGRAAAGIILGIVGIVTIGMMIEGPDNCPACGYNERKDGSIKKRDDDEN